MEIFRKSDAKWRHNSVGKSIYRKKLYYLQLMLSAPCRFSFVPQSHAASIYFIAEIYVYTYIFRRLEVQL
jgi:uncharacterized membrane protein YpjA